MLNLSLTFWWPAVLFSTAATCTLNFTVLEGPVLLPPPSWSYSDPFSGWTWAALGLGNDWATWEAQPATLDYDVLLVDHLPSAPVGAAASLSTGARYRFCEWKQDWLTEWRNDQPWSELPGNADISQGSVQGIDENPPPQKRLVPNAFIHEWRWWGALQHPPRANITLIVLLSWLSLLCHIKRQHVLSVSVRFP